MNPVDIGKFVEEMFQWEPHRIGALVTGVVLGFSACWLLFRRRDAPLHKSIRLLQSEIEEQTRRKDSLQSQLTALQDQQLTHLHGQLDDRDIPRGQRVVMAWTRAGRRIPVCILNRGEKTHRVLFPDGKDDKVQVDELSAWC